jgi:surface carbohydrate biosynthesis protein (TIGR04326 family)
LKNLKDTTVELWFNNKPHLAHEGDNIYIWDGGCSNIDLCSVLDYVEANSVSLREKYLKFVHELGLYEINGKPIVEHLSCYHGYNLWWMSNIAVKSHINSPNITDCIKLFALEEMLKLNKATSLVVYGYNKNSPVFEAIRSLCNNLNISYTYKDIGKKKRNKLLDYVRRFRPEWLSVLRYLFLYLKSNWTVFNKENIDWYSGDKSIIFFIYLSHLETVKCLDGEFKSKSWGNLPSTIRSLGLNVNWIHHAWSANLPDTAQTWIDCFNRNTSHRETHALFENYLSTPLIIRTLINYCRLYLKSFSLFKIPKAFQPTNSSVDFWPLLKDDWLKSLRGGVAMRNLMFIQAVDNIFKDLPYQRLGLYAQENMYWERALLHGWRYHGHGKIIGVPLGTINFWDMRFAEDVLSYKVQRTKLSLPLPDNIALHGPVAKEFYQNAGYPMKATVKVEALRYLHLGKTPNANVIRDNVCTKDKINIIIFGELSGDSTMEMLKVVNNAFADNDSVSLTLKPHPICIANFDELAISVTLDPIEELLPKYDLSIIARTTSAAIDVYYSGGDVVVFLGDKELNLSPLRGFDDTIFVRTSSELISVIESFGKRKILFDKKEYFYIDNTLPRWKYLVIN